MSSNGLHIHIKEQHEKNFELQLEKMMAHNQQHDANCGKK